MKLEKWELNNTHWFLLEQPSFIVISFYPEEILEGFSLALIWLAIFTSSLAENIEAMLIRFANDRN